MPELWAYSSDRLGEGQAQGRHVCPGVRLLDQGAYHGSAKACPLDTTKYFNWNEAGQASIFLRIVPG